jgi:hypothetical protein
VSRCGYSMDNCSRHNNSTIKSPAWTVSEKRWKSWRNRTASNCAGHKKDTAPGWPLIGRSGDRPSSHGPGYAYNGTFFEVKRSDQLTLDASTQPGCQHGQEEALTAAHNRCATQPLTAPPNRLRKNSVQTALPRMHGSLNLNHSGVRSRIILWSKCAVQAFEPGLQLRS